jgi:hypothetical protein
MRSTRPIDPPHEPHGQASVNQGVAITTGMSTLHEYIQGHHVHTLVISTNLNVLFFDDGKRLPDFRHGIEPAPDHFQRHPPGVFCTQLPVNEGVFTCVLM